MRLYQFETKQLQYKKKKRLAQLAFKQPVQYYIAIDGFFIEEEDLRDYCMNCFTLLRYSEQYEALYCATCNEWREFVCECEGASCEVCRNRPEQPFE